MFSSAENPNGIPSFSPGLARSDYPGSSSKKSSTPTGLHHYPLPWDSTPSELIQFGVPASRRSPIASVNAGLDDVIPSGYFPPPCLVVAFGLWPNLVEPHARRHIVSRGIFAAPDSLHDSPGEVTIAQIKANPRPN